MGVVPIGFTADEWNSGALSVPHLWDDEKYVLSCAIWFDNVARRVVAELDLEDFHVTISRRVFIALSAIVDRGETPNAYSVSREICKANPDPGNPFDNVQVWDLQAVYDKDYYADTRGLPEAIRRLREVSGYRLLIDASKSVLARSYSQDGTPGDILDTLAGVNSRLLQKSTNRVVWADEAVDEALRYYTLLRDRGVVAVPSGFPELDSLLYGGGFWAGDFVVIAGETSSGKTSLALNILLNAARAGVRVLMFSLEMKRFKLISRLHSASALVPGWKIRPGMDEQGEGIHARLHSTAADIRLPYAIDDTARDLSTMRRKATHEVKENKVGLIIVDYLQLMKPPKGSRGSTYEKVTENSRGLKELASDLDVPVLGISSLRRKYKEEKARDEEEESSEPQLDMLRDSGGIEFDADTVALIWGKKTEENCREKIVDRWIKLAKQRNGELGRFKTKFAPDIYRFTSAQQLAALEEIRF